MNPALVLFGIDACLRLGRKIYDVTLDEIREAPLPLPIGPVIGLPSDQDAIDFFDAHEEYDALFTPAGPYTDGDRKRLHLQLGGIDTAGSTAAERAEALRGLLRIDQVAPGAGARPAAQRILGTLVEIGLDYIVTNPAASARDSTARRVITHFATGLADIDFAEAGDLADSVLRGALTSALAALGDETAGLTRDPRLSALLGGVTGALLEEIETPGASAGDTERRRRLFERVTAGIVRGAAGAVAENPALFIASSKDSAVAVRSILTPLLAAATEHDDLFTSESMEELARGALLAASEQRALLTDSAPLQALIERSVAALTTGSAQRVFTRESIAPILEIALDTAAHSIPGLLDPQNPGRQPLAAALAAMAHGLSAGHRLEQLLTTGQLTELAAGLLRLAARHPEKLIGGTAHPPLAAILAALASALGNDAPQLTGGHELVALAETVAATALHSTDLLLAPGDVPPAAHPLRGLLREFAQAALDDADQRHLFDPVVFRETVELCLPVLTANLDPALSRPAIIGDTIRAALDLSTGPLRHRIHSGNLPLVLRGMLRDALDGSADPTARALDYLS